MNATRYPNWAATRYPNWIYDVVSAIEKHEDEHPSDGFCMSDILNMVPFEVRTIAEAITRYKENSK